MSQSRNQKLLPNGRDEPVSDLYYSVPLESKRRCTCSTIPIVFCVISIILCITAVIMLCLVYVTSGHSQKPPLNQTASSEFPEICTACLNILKNQFNPTHKDPLINKLVKKMDDGIQKCCAKSSEQLSELFEMMNSKMEAVPAHGAMFQNDAGLKSYPVSAQKYLILPERDSKERDHITLQFDPDNNDSLVEHALGVEVKRDAMEIQNTGLYYVFLNSNFLPNFTSSTLNHNHNRMVPALLHVYRVKPPSDSEILLEAEHSTDMLTMAKTVYIDGKFHLRATDRLQVRLSGFDMATIDPESTFLGLFMLESGREEIYI